MLAATAARTWLSPFDCRRLMKEGYDGSLLPCSRYFHFLHRDRKEASLVLQSQAGPRDDRWSFPSPICPTVRGRGKGGGREGSIWKADQGLGYQMDGNIQALFLLACKHTSYGSWPE